MKITKQQLEQIIKEEVKTVLGEEEARPSVHQQYIDNLLAGDDDFDKKWSPDALAAVGKAWKLIDELANDIQAASTVHVVHHGTDKPLEYGDTWQMAKELGHRIWAATSPGEGDRKYAVNVRGTTGAVTESDDDDDKEPDEEFKWGGLTGERYKELKDAASERWAKRTMKPPKKEK